MIIQARYFINTISQQFRVASCSTHTHTHSHMQTVQRDIIIWAAEISTTDGTEISVETVFRRNEIRNMYFTKLHPQFENIDYRLIRDNLFSTGFLGLQFWSKVNLKLSLECEYYRILAYALWTIQAHYTHKI